MSTGAHDLDEVAESVSALRDAGVSDLVVLQCVAAYPTPLSEINVRAIEILQEEFDVLSGLSDHTLDPVTAPSAAVALGASVVEKHFTLDKSMEGLDHQFAIEPDEFDQMISAIRDTEKALGTGEKQILEIEQELYQKARRAIHATETIPQGNEFTPNNIDILRPGSREQGINPKFYDEVIGNTATRNIQKGAGIQWEDIEGYES
jgi:N-acetylneuraminate synthase